MEFLVFNPQEVGGSDRQIDPLCMEILHHFETMVETMVC